MERRPGHRKREVLFFLPEDIGLWRRAETRVLFGSRFTRQVAVALLLHPGATAEDLAPRLHLTPVNVRYHMRKLQHNRLLVTVRDGSQLRYRPAPKLERWWNEVGKRYATEAPEPRRDAWRE